MIKKVLGVGLAVAAVLAAVALGSPDSGAPPAETAEPAEADVIMPTKSSRPGCEEDDMCYIPSSITVAPGGQVTWVNEDSAFHSVTSGSYDSPDDLFDSGYMDPSESYVVTFDEAGTYEYFCTLHPWMQGVVVVG